MLPRAPRHFHLGVMVLPRGGARVAAITRHDRVPAADRVGAAFGKVAALPATCAPKAGKNPTSNGDGGTRFAAANGSFIVAKSVNIARSAA